MKIMIVGFSGSGKSTLAKKLSDIYNVPVLYMDTIQFESNWIDRDSKEAEEMVNKFLSENETWVIDGNYSRRFFEERAKLADTIIFLNYNRFSCLYRAFKRANEYKNKTRESITEGCNERMNLSFIYWILHQGRTKKYTVIYEYLRNNYKDKLLEFKKQEELDKYLESIKL